ncbi:hypothetical protein JZ751_000154 [Albula glossodonta]|uniref:exodeoxyribonuclease III n=1 Tax=Albula glossodonta TaxID=121402 RepID=A0A8T2PVR6_9TELE|nr:hypothetical protein JZ751_000154 [Albula glossodonta]
MVPIIESEWNMYPARGQRELCFVTWNTRGLHSTKASPRKTANVLGHLAALGTDVAFLQETHIGSEDTRELEGVVGWRTFLTVHDPFRKGVAILVRQDVEFEHVGQDEDCEGSYFVLTCRLHGCLYTLASVYNHQRDKRVLCRLTRYLQEMGAGVLVIGGDFNTVLNPNLDRTSSSRNAHHTILRRCVVKMAARLRLVDIWRKQNPAERAYSHRDAKTKGCSRIDFFLVPWATVGYVLGCCIHGAPTGLSDHYPVSLRLLPAPPEGPCLTLQLHGMVPPPQLATPLVCLWLRQKHQTLLSKAPPDERWAGRVSGGEVLASISSLMDYGNPVPDGVPVSFYRRACGWMLTSHLKALYNGMLEDGLIPDSFSDTISLPLGGTDHCHHCFNVDYLIFATVLATRIGKGLELVAKTDDRVSGGAASTVVVAYGEGLKRVRWLYLAGALEGEAQGRHTLSHVIRVLERLLKDAEGPGQISSDRYKELRRGCPLTPVLLSLCMKRLAERIRSHDPTIDAEVQPVPSYPHKTAVVIRGFTSLSKCNLSAELQTFSIISGLTVTMMVKEADDMLAGEDGKANKTDRSPKLESDSKICTVQHT